MDTLIRLVMAWFAGLLLWLAIGLLMAVPLMRVWNWLMPKLLGLSEVGYLEAFGLILLTRLLFAKTEVKKTYNDA